MTKIQNNSTFLTRIEEAVRVTPNHTSDTHPLRLFLAYVLHITDVFVLGQSVDLVSAEGGLTLIVQLHSEAQTITGYARYYAWGIAAGVVRVEGCNSVSKLHVCMWRDTLLVIMELARSYRK